MLDRPPPKQVATLRTVDEGELVAIPGPLTGEALEKERQARRLRAHLLERERYRRWQAGEPEDPELARWHADDEI